MTLRCKVGDLAVVTRGECLENRGKIVRITEFLGSVPGWLGHERWRVDRACIVGSFGSVVDHVRDENLTPIRPDADPESITTDETLEMPA